MDRASALRSLVVRPTRVGRAGVSVIGDETVERLKQRIDDRLTQRLSGLADLSFVSAAGRGGQIRTVICQNRIGPDRKPIARNRPGCRRFSVPRRRAPSFTIPWPIPGYDHGARQVLRSREYILGLSGFAEQAVRFVRSRTGQERGLFYSPDALVRLTRKRSRRRWYLRVISAEAWPSCFCT